MRFATGDGAHFSLTIVAYQFPTGARYEDDANWLRIRIDAADGKGAPWTSTDPCRLTWEAIQLAEWLEAVAAGRAHQPTDFIDFLEPNLRFEAMTDDRSQPTVRVSFELESRPPWAESRVVGEYPLWIDFVLSPNEISNAAASLRKQMEAFPRRRVGEG